VCRGTNGAHIGIYWAHKETLWNPTFENVSIFSIHFMVKNIYCFILL